ncbi:MAG TPA: hypothetical protein VGU71_00815 [Candidatus Dormibacteraeota bacterium]|nr:hypothetical protein [Candidatus Dormibacteraeota bacterium]
MGFSGFNPDVLVTGDGGLTWTAVTSGSSQVLAAITCPSVSSCYASGFGGNIGSLVITTTDGGFHWSTQNPGTNQWLTAISCPAIGICYSAGTAGAILSSFSRAPVVQSSNAAPPDRSPSTQSSPVPPPPRQSLAQPASRAPLPVVDPAQAKVESTLPGAGAGSASTVLEMHLFDWPRPWFILVR